MQKPQKILSVLYYLLLANQLHADNLRDITTIEYQKLKKVCTESLSMTLGQLIFTNEAQSHVTTNNSDVYISLTQIERYTKDSGQKFQEAFIKFILAHEIGHKLQINSYKKKYLIDNSKGESRVFLECYADILAGFLMTSVFTIIEIPEILKQNPNADLATINKLSLTTSLSVYKRITEMDRLNTLIKTHPRNEERLMAIRQGTILGNIYSMYIFFYHSDTTTSPLPQETLNQYKEVYHTLVKALDYDPQNSQKANMFFWAHSEAIRIIHENNSLARTLIIYDKTIEWDKSASNPYVSVSFKVMNTGPKAVRFSGRITTEMIPRNDRANIVNISPVDGYSFDTYISPNQSEHFSAKLRWAATEEHMPRVILPGDKRSLYWVFDKLNPEVDITDAEEYYSGIDPAKESSLENTIELIAVVLGKIKNLYAFTKGIGHSNEISSQKVLKGKINYAPLVDNGPAYEHTIEIDKDESLNTFSFIAFQSSNEASAKKYFKTLINEITTNFPQKLDVDTYEKNSYSEVEFSLPNNQQIICYLEYDNDEKTYRISVELQGPIE